MTSERKPIIGEDSSAPRNTASWMEASCSGVSFHLQTRAGPRKERVTISFVGGYPAIATKMKVAHWKDPHPACSMASSRDKPRARAFFLSSSSVCLLLAVVAKLTLGAYTSGGMSCRCAMVHSLAQVRPELCRFSNSCRAREQGDGDQRCLVPSHAAARFCPRGHSRHLAPTEADVPYHKRIDPNFLSASPAAGSRKVRCSLRRAALTCVSEELACGNLFGPGARNTRLMRVRGYRQALPPDDAVLLINLQ
mmetsp:Transcript_3288/g.9452  ORF Transcript_3288/g.9452 Transcript_3288/m.9452 type:complete len:251 (+) Transcript_3288:2764-3516(+)